jgi:mono/diheme cytochrome c family protein
LKSKFGILYGPNITPDVETGIGSWSKADFDSALRLGIGKDKKYLYPAMPYDAYTKLRSEDVDALWAYFRTVPAVRNTPPKNTLPWPLTVRSGLAVWQSLYFKPGPFVPDAAKDAEWNHGAYLVEALAHCSDCHTPRNIAQGPETQHPLGGAQIEGWYAPDISNDASTVLKTFSTDQLARFLKGGTTPRNTKAFGPMQEAVHDSLHRLTDADVHAMAVYLKDQPGAEAAEHVSAAQFAAGRFELGRRVYENNCSGCHQSDGKGMPGSVPALAGNAAVTAGEPWNVIMALLLGFPPQGTWGAMASFAQTLNDEQIADVANYVRTAWGNSAPPNATPWAVSTWRKTAGPAQERSLALLCPNLPPDVVSPALRQSPDSLRGAASSADRMAALVGSYRSARPQTSPAEVIEALSTAYCRTLAADHTSESRMSAQLADFAQRVAEALNTHNTHKTAT